MKEVGTSQSAYYFYSHTQFRLVVACSCKYSYTDGLHIRTSRGSCPSIQHNNWTINETNSFAFQKLHLFSATHTASLPFVAVH